MFWFKPSKIHVDCFIKTERIATLNPVRNAHHFVPDWWKKLDSTVSVPNQYGMVLKRPTMKSCIGFIEMYRTGLIIPMWCDFIMEVGNGSYRYQSAISDAGYEGEEIVTLHPSAQSGNYYKNKLNIKLQCPWQFKEKTNVKFLYAPCTWTTNEKLPKMQFLNGIMQFKYQTAAHVQSFVPVEENQYKIEIEAGMPLMQLIPLSEKRVVPHIQVVNRMEYERIKTTNSNHKFIGGYLDLMKHISK